MEGYRIHIGDALAYLGLILYQPNSVNFLHIFSE